MMIAQYAGVSQILSSSSLVLGISSLVTRLLSFYLTALQSSYKLSPEYDFERRTQEMAEKKVETGT
jgi:hypothetical protein